MFLPWGVSLGIKLEFDSSTISSRFIVVESKISGRISSRSTSITLRILGRTSHIAKAFGALGILLFLLG
jgi:uncharacterized membrane protein required for colicin V production